MKSWLRKLKISASLDEAKPLPERLRERIASSEDLRRFEQNALKLDSALRASRPPLEAPPSLHSSIMDAVDAASRADPAPRRAPALYWLPAPALGLVLLAGWWLLHRPSPEASRRVADSQSLALVARALETSDAMTRSLPVAVITPLSDELERVSLDLDHTKQFLLANVP